MKKAYLECGKVCNAHGVRGVIKVESWCDSPKVLASSKRVYILSKDGEYEEKKVLTSSVSDRFVLMTLMGVESREDAILMKNTVLYLKREDIPIPEGAVLLEDMIGIPVIDADTGRVYGTVKEINDAVRGKLYTVSTPSGEVLYPSAPGFIEEVDPERGMFIRPIPGFFDDEI